MFCALTPPANIPLPQACTMNNAFSELFLIIFLKEQWELERKNCNVFLATWAFDTLFEAYVLPP